MKVISFFFVSKHNKKLSNKLFFLLDLLYQLSFFFISFCFTRFSQHANVFLPLIFSKFSNKIEESCSTKIRKKKNNLKEFFFFFQFSVNFSTKVFIEFFRLFDFACQQRRRKKNRQED